MSIHEVFQVLNESKSGVDNVSYTPAPVKIKDLSVELTDKANTPYGLTSAFFKGGPEMEMLLGKAGFNVKRLMKALLSECGIHTGLEIRLESESSSEIIFDIVTTRSKGLVYKLHISKNVRDKNAYMVSMGDRPRALSNAFKGSEISSAFSGVRNTKQALDVISEIGKTYYQFSPYAEGDKYIWIRVTDSMGNDDILRIRKG